MTFWYPAPTLLPDVEQVLNPWLQSELLSVYSVTARVLAETPDNLQEIVPCVQLYRITGSDRAYPMILDVAQITINSFGADRPSASQLGRQVHALICQLPGSTISGANFGAVEVIAGPRWLPYGDLNLRRFNATYAITMKAA